MEGKVLARVGNLTVTEEEINEMIMSLMQRGQNLNNPEGRAMVLEQMIANKLFLLDAGKNMYEYNAEFKAQLQKVKEDMLISFAMAKALETVKPATDDEIKAFYEENKERFGKGESVNASHILVDSEDKANEILAKINAGEISFEDAARAESSCPSKENGGNLGEFTRGQMVKEFDEAVFAMEVGEIKGPVKTQFGFHLIKLCAKNEAKAYEFEEIKSELSDMVTKEKQQKAYQSKINQLKILYPVDKM
ncbi:MAG: peptidylprolyl isomerase [Clostridia bacterium]|nr:peptidylprolyl isomerase [Clostridia bacterium]